MKKTKSKIDFKADIKKEGAFKDLKEVAIVATKLQAQQNKLEELEEQVDNARAAIYMIQTEELPAIMEQFNLSEFKLKDGSKITVRPFVKASLPSEGAILKCKDPDKQGEMRTRLSNAFIYLRKQGAGAMIKTFLKADFGKDSEPLARKAILALRKLGVRAEVAKNVHPQTLTAWVKERIEAGKKIDMDLFAVASGNMAILKEQPSNLVKVANVKKHPFGPDAEVKGAESYDVYRSGGGNMAKPAYDYTIWKSGNEKEDF
jgi:hypothetical protein